MGENELYHHGVVGMKWGVRRYQNKDSTLTEAGKRQNAKQKEKYEKKYAKTKELTPDERKLKFLKVDLLSSYINTLIFLQVMN